MEYKEILDILAPCGLNCCKCYAYSVGEIKIHSTKLQELLGSFDKYAERFSAFLPIFKSYPSFKELLQHFTKANCNGCRKGTCIYPDCGVITCYQNKGVDFCFQCDEFPCEKTNFDLDLKGRWIQMNNRMKEIGIESYYQETNNLPRYR
ncbi:MAG: DUF3795 domain-containing protein [Fidelibacterota bacterium]|nr:MAG: DUF3795 domain-containing protein [Candidatus Neomarinimicrobiota bacterium]